MRKLKKTRLIWLIVISLVLGLFFPALLMAEVREESEDLSLYRIEGTTDETYLRDHLMTLLDTIEDQGYELREDVQEEFHTLSLGWLGSTADDMRHTQSVIISDSPYEHDLPFRDRSLLLHYTSSTVEGEDALTTLLEEMAAALDLDVSDLEPPDPDFEETSRGSYPLEDTDSSIHYLFIKSESLSESPGTVHLSARLYPLSYAEDEIIDAIAGIADYLYAQQETIESPLEIIASAMIRETHTDVLSSHLITYRTTYLLDEISSISHSISFESDVSDEEIQAALTYLEENLPGEMKGFADMVTEIPEIRDEAVLSGAGWEALLNRYADQTVFWLSYNPEVEGS